MSYLVPDAKWPIQTSSKQPLLARHEPVVSGSHFDECFGRLRMTLLVRVKLYRKDPKPSTNGLSRMS